MKYQGNGKNNTIKTFIICTLHLVLIQSLNEDGLLGGWDGEKQYGEERQAYTHMHEHG